MKIPALLTALLALAIPQTARAYGGPIVVELFTSQSCSSCPAADKVLGQIAQDGRVIALSCNVTYWDHLGWKDTLSKQFCTDRQHAYAASLKARGPYTPQAVINGRYDAVGSREAVVRGMMARAGGVHTIELETAENGTLSVTLPEINPGAYTLSLFAFDKTHAQKIPSGENRGRTVNYTHPVKHLVPLGGWNGQQKTITQDISTLPVTGGYAVLVQDKTGNILAAGQTAF